MLVGDFYSLPLRAHTVAGGGGYEKTSLNHLLFWDFGIRSSWSLVISPFALALLVEMIMEIITELHQVIPEGTPTFAPLTIDQSAQGTAMCVADMKVNVDIDHQCIGQLYLTLYGPGPSTLDANNLENTARAEPAVLFSGYHGTDCSCTEDTRFESTADQCTETGGSSGECGEVVRVSFSDTADEGMMECCRKGR